MTFKFREGSWESKVIQQNERHQAFLDNQVYRVELDLVGDLQMSNGDPKRMLQDDCHVEHIHLTQIPELIKFIQTPFWRHPKLTSSTTKAEAELIPFEEKKWGRYRAVRILDRISTD